MKQETYEYIEDQLEEMEEDADSIKAGVNCIRKALKDSKEPTFKETFELLEKQGWEKITPQQYSSEKFNKKHQTARVGLHGFFRLKEGVKK